VCIVSDSLLVIGIGHPDRADDGVGPLVAARLAVVARLANVAHIEVAECRGDVLALMDRWSAIDAVVLVDAAMAMAQPGRIHRIDASRGADCESSLAPARASTHEVGVAETIALAAALGRLPRRVIIYAIEATCFQAGAPMTAEVAAAAERLPELIVEEVQLLRREFEALAPADRGALASEVRLTDENSAARA
jgi:hydrogenase maturation protease